MPPVRICAGGGQRWSSLPRPNLSTEVAFSTFEAFACWDRGDCAFAPRQVSLATAVL